MFVGLFFCCIVRGGEVEGRKGWSLHVALLG